MSDDMCGEEVFEKYLTSKDLDSVEGSRAVKNLNVIARDLGYEQLQCADGSSLENFLRDNPGCVTVIYDWIKGQLDHSDEWKQNLINEIPQNEEEEDA